MALKNLNPSAMLSISSSWVDPARDRPVIQSLPLASALLPALDQVNGNLIAKQYVRVTIEKEIAAVVDAELQADGTHDRSKRGVFTFLSALAELARDPGRAASYLDLRDCLMPLGLMETRRPYLEQVGDAEALPGRLDPEKRTLLASIETPEGPLQSHVDTWIAAAGDLGRLEKRRAEIESQRSAGQSVSAAEARAVKLTWIRVVRALVNLIEVDEAATPEIKDRILAPLYRAEALADRRARGPVGDDEDDIVPEPTDPTEPADPVITLPVTE